MGNFLKHFYLFFNGFVSEMKRDGFIDVFYKKMIKKLFKLVKGFEFLFFKYSSFICRDMLFKCLFFYVFIIYT